MKIIGKGEHTYIIEATKDEVANLMREYSKYDIKDLKCGTTIDIKELYSQYRDLHSTLLSKNITGARKELTRIVSLLTPIEEVVTISNLKTDNISKDDI